MPFSRHRSADNFLIAELDVGEGVILPIESNRAQQCDDDIRNLLHDTNFYVGILTLISHNNVVMYCTKKNEILFYKLYLSVNQSKRL